MAIFRQGVKVGPFDLRLGIPRDKSLDNVDKDPRLRQYANTENQMGRFRAAMAAANGYARTTRFAVRIYPPTNLEHQVNAAQETDTRSGGNYAVRNSTSGKQMSDINEKMDEAVINDDFNSIENIALNPKNAYVNVSKFNIFNGDRKSVV